MAALAPEIQIMAEPTPQGIHRDGESFTRGVRRDHQVGTKVVIALIDLRLGRHGFDLGPDRLELGRQLIDPADQVLDPGGLAHGSRPNFSLSGG
jgi:hypothetical protein